MRYGVGFHPARHDTVSDHGTCLARGFSRAGERNIREPAQTHVATLVADLNTKNHGKP